MPNDKYKRSNNAILAQALKGLNPDAYNKVVRARKMNHYVNSSDYGVIATDKCCPSPSSPKRKGKVLSPVIVMDTCHGIGTFNADVFTKSKLDEFSPTTPLINMTVPNRYSDGGGDDVNFSPTAGDLRQYKIDGLFFYFPPTGGSDNLTSLINVTIKGFTTESGLNPAATDYQQDLSLLIPNSSTGATVVVAFRDEDGNYYPLQWNNQIAVDGTTNIAAKPYTVSIDGYPAQAASVIHAPLNSNLQIVEPALRAFAQAYGG